MTLLAAPPPAFRTMALPVVALIAMAATSAALIALIREPFHSPGGWAAAQVVLLAGAVMLTWHEAAARVLDGRWNSYALALLATLAVLFSPTLVILLGAIAAVPLSLILAAVWFVGGRGLIQACRHQRWWEVSLAVAGGCALGLVYFLYVNTKGYGNVFAPEQTLLGIQHRDTLYHSSVAAMLGAFGVPSTGLDGVVPLRYHFLSHALIGATGRWMGVAPIHAYYLTHQVVGISLLLFSVSAASCWMWRASGSERGGLLSLSIPLLLLLIFESWDWASYLVSESFALSLVLLLLSLPLMIELHERPLVPRPWVRYGVLVIAGLAILLAKNSVGALFACGVLYCAARAGRVSVIRILAFAAAVTIVVAIGMAVTSASGYSEQSLFGPMHFVRTYPDAAWPNTIAIGVVLIAAAWAWITMKHQRVTVEALTVLCTAALVCGWILQIGSGAAYYFMNVGVWVGIVLVAGALLPRLAAVDARGLVSALSVGAVAMAMIADDEKRTAGTQFVALAQRVDVRARGTTGAVPAVGDIPARTVWEVLSPGDPVRTHLAGAIGQTAGGVLQQQLKAAALSATPPDAVFVPPTNEAFWGLADLCTAQPFFVPALVGLPLLLGLPPDATTCPLPPDTGYGYGEYGESSRSAVIGDSALCEHSVQRGFEVVLILEQAGGRLLTCR